MKKIFLIIYALITISILTNCDPSSPTPSTNFKIKTLSILYLNDTIDYAFTYTGDNLTAISRDGRDYASLTTTSNEAWVIMKYNFYHDTFKINFNANKFIDSIRHFNGTDYRNYFRNASNIIDSCRYTESNISLFYKNYSYTPGQPIYYDHSNVYTCGVFNTCTQTNKDTVSYNTHSNQTNIPEQFTTFPFSEGLSLLDLNPMYIAQQNGIYTYQPHLNLISNLNTSYSILVSQSPPKRFHFRYEYTFDSQNRVSLIYQYDDLSSTTIPLRTYVITYFD